jgi:hypothetical protein
MKLIYDHPRSVDRSKSNGFKAYNPPCDFGFGFSYATSEGSNFSLDKSEILQEDLKYVNAEDNWVSEPGLFSVSVGVLSKDFKLK